MTVNNFLQHPGDFNTHFDDDYEVLQWTAESGVTLSRYESDPDTDHSSVMKMVTTDATHGTYIGQTVYENMKYVFEFQYKCDTGKELKIRVYDVTHNAWITLDPHTICSIPMGSPLNYITITSASWYNCYVEFTTPAGCTSIRLHIISNSTGTNNFYIDALLCQGNALMRDPENPVTYNYPDIRQTHSMINGSQIIDRTARRIAIAMSFPFLEHTYFERLLDFANSPDEAYFYDQAIPPVITEAFLHTETTDDYSDTTNNKAYTDASVSQPSAAGDFESTEFTVGEYANVADDDTDYCEKTAATTGHYAYHKFKIHALEYGAVDLIHKFTITWKGSGTGGISLYLWDGVNWVKCDESYTSDKHTLTFSTTKKEVAQEYWVSGYIRAIAQARTPKTATNTVSLKTYYIQTVINEDMGAEVELIDKAFLDAYGDVTAVYNVTDSASLTLSTHYTIRDDRKAVVTIGQTDGDLIRVTYNRYLKVGSAGLTANRLNSTSISSPYQQVSLSLEGLTVAE